VSIVREASRARDDPITFTIANVLHPRRFASRHAPSVSAVSPLWLIRITMGRSAGARE